MEFSLTEDQKMQVMDRMDEIISLAIETGNFEINTRECRGIPKNAEYVSREWIHDYDMKELINDAIRETLDA